MSLKQIFLKTFLCLSLLSIPAGWAQEKKLIPSAASPKIAGETAKETVVEGISLIQITDDLSKANIDHGIHINLGKKGYADLKKTLQNYLNHPLTDSYLKLVKRAIIDYFHAKKKQHVTVIIPVQEVRNGVIIIQVMEGKVGKITFNGQKWFSESVIRKGVHLEESGYLVEEDMLNDLSWLNRNPFHHTQVILTPGQEFGLTNVEFLTKDRFPARFYMGSDNTGFISNGMLRYFAGGNWGNAFMIGDILSYQYSASQNFHQFQSHVVNYSSLLSTKHLLTVYGCYAQMFPDIPGYNSTGKCAQGSIRYHIPIKPLYGTFRSHVETGFDFKYVNSALFFNGNPAEAPPPDNSQINVTQFLGSYGLQRNWDRNVLTFDGKAYFSVWKDLFPHQTTAAYAGLRPFSHVRYIYFQASLSNQYQTESGWVFSTLLRGQLASCTLPSTEQFGLGGENTVRGYYEQQFIADNAACFNLEVYTPSFSIFKKNLDKCSFLGFFDCGYGYNYSAEASPYIRQLLIGMGPGLRYDIAPYLNVILDYGFQFIGIPGDHRLGRWHFSVIAGY
jgi:hemolysin activation/secretion protein